MKKNKLIIFILLICLSINSFSQSKNIMGKPIPENIMNSKLYNIAGDSLVLSTIIEENKGKVIYINFWASWCKTCRYEMPYSVKLDKKFSDNDVKFIYISTDEVYLAWIDALNKVSNEGLNYKLDSAAKAEIKNYFNIKGIPYIIILDKNGNIAAKNAKYPSNVKSETQITKILNIK